MPNQEILQSLDTVFSADCGPALACAYSLSISMDSLRTLITWIEKRIKNDSDWLSLEGNIEKWVPINTVELMGRLGPEAVEKVASGLYSKVPYRRVVAYLLLGLFSTRQDNHSVLSTIGLAGFPKFFFGDELDNYVNEDTILDYAWDCKFDKLEYTPRELAARGPLKSEWLSADH